MILEPVLSVAPDAIEMSASPVVCGAVNDAVGDGIVADQRQVCTVRVNSRVDQDAARHSSVRLPGVPDEVSSMGLSIVISSLAWRVTFVPASRLRVKKWA